jgi:hypothetical protein
VIWLVVMLQQCGHLLLVRDLEFQHFMTLKINDGSDGEQPLNYISDPRNFDVDMMTH